MGRRMKEKNQSSLGNKKDRQSTHKEEGEEREEDEAVEEAGENSITTERICLRKSEDNTSSHN